MVYTVRLAGLGRQGGRNGFEQQLRDWHVVQKNSRPNHPTTCGKVERFQQTLKNWLHRQPQPATIAELQALLDAFVDEYNHRRPHRSLPHRATPAALYNAMPKALPGQAATPTPTTGSATTGSTNQATVTLRVHGQLRHIGIGRTHTGTHVILLVQDLHVRVVQRRHRRASTRAHHRSRARLPTQKQQRSEPPMRVRIFPISCEITRSG